MTYDEIETAALALDSEQQQRLRYSLTIELELYPLAYLSSDDVVELASEEFQNDDALEQACSDAAYRVWTKWSGSGDLEGSAQDWALDIVRGSAAARGLTPAEQELTD